MKVFAENALELLPAYFILAEANIGMGGSRLKKAEQFLMAAKWNLLKFKDDKSEEKSRVGDDSLVSAQEIEQYQALLNRTFGKLFMAQNRIEAFDELTQGIYKDSLKYGPESIQLSSSYFHMGQLFLSQERFVEAKSFYLKICEIWKRYVLEEAQTMESDETTGLLIDEAWKHLHEILAFLEQLRDDNTTATADCLFALSLVTFSTGRKEDALDEMTRCYEIYSQKLGDYAKKTKEVEETI